MKHTLGLAAVALLGALGLLGCERSETAAGRAVEGAQDALDLREHEKLRDATEDAADAVENATEGLRDEVGGR